MAIVKYSKKKAHQVYRKKDGTIVPGGSTIAGVGDSQEHLLTWYYNMGVKGEDPKAHMREAGNIGTVAHGMIECHFNGNIGDFDDFSKTEIDMGTMLYDKFMKWWSENNLEFVASETQLVSEVHGYGGTLDLIFRRNGGLGLLDVKSSPQIYLKNYRQLALYENLWNENNTEKIEHRVIVRLDKKSPKKTEVRWIGDLEDHFNVALKKLALYQAEHES